MSDQDRELGPEMVAEGWLSLGGDSITWGHHPSFQVVVLSGPWKRSGYGAGWAMAPGEPEAVEVYAVSRYKVTEDGEPSDDDWDGFLTASYATALKSARETRARILANKPRANRSTQLTFDDLLERNGESNGR